MILRGYNYTYVDVQVMGLFVKSRKAAGLTQQQVGDRIGINRSTVSAIETGRLVRWIRHMRFIQLYLAACGFDVVFSVNQVAYTDEEAKSLLLSRGLVKPNQWDVKTKPVKAAKEPVPEAEK